MVVDGIVGRRRMGRRPEVGDDKRRSSLSGRTCSAMVRHRPARVPNFRREDAQGENGEGQSAHQAAEPDRHVENVYRSHRPKQSPRHQHHGGRRGSDSPARGRFDTVPRMAVGFRMRLAAMRHAASLVLALVWAVARLAQPLNATCPHHALASIAAVTAEQRASADVHTASHAHLHDAGTGTTTPASAPAPTEAPAPAPADKTDTTGA